MQLEARPSGRSFGKKEHSRETFIWIVGAGMLVPGLAQLNWRQHERGLVFLLSFLSALVVSVFCWGTLMGGAFLAFTFVTHAASTIDLLKQRSFPVFPRFMTLVSTLGSLGMTAYLPLGTILTLYAFPAHPDGPAGIGYLVNRLAYRAAAPSPGHCVWMRLSQESPPRAGRIVAVAGQEVEWTSRHWLVDGREVPPPQIDSALYYPNRYQFRVPEHHLLVGLENDSARMVPCGPMVLISQDQIVGRVWARYSPFWDRRLL